MPSFPGVDFLDFDSLLSDEEKLARNTARQFVDAEIMPIIEEYNREGKFPVQLVPQMADLASSARASRATDAPACPTWNTDW